MTELHIFPQGIAWKALEGEGDVKSAAQVFYDTVREKAEIGQVMGETLVSFDKMLIPTLRS